MLAAVTTTGVNPEALAATLGPLLAMLGGGIKWLASRVDQHHGENVAVLEDVRSRVDSINTHGSLPMQALGERLTTIEAHLERQDRASVALSERVARLEGPVRRAAAAQTAADQQGG